MSTLPESSFAYVPADPERVDALTFFNEWVAQQSVGVTARAFYHPNGEQWVNLNLRRYRHPEQEIVLPLSVLADIVAGAGLAFMTSAAARLAPVAKRSA